LHCQDGEQVERAGVRGMLVQQRFERTLRIGNLARLQQCKRALKHFVRRESHWAFLYGW
jgi:hypothetical protein